MPLVDAVVPGVATATSGAASAMEAEVPCAWYAVTRVWATKLLGQLGGSELVGVAVPTRRPKKLQEQLLCCCRCSKICQDQMTVKSRKYDLRWEVQEDQGQRRLVIRP